MYLGIDIGSVSIKYSVIDKDYNVVEYDYIRTNGDIVNATKKILSKIKTKKIKSVITTGSARNFIKELINADMDIDEITAHRKAISKLYPKVKTIFEIGGQDSKLIYFGDKFANFEMNNVCAAGTGSFLDQQASRLSLSIEDFCKKGLEAKKSHTIASKCTVFAESDMINGQQSGVPINEIIRGVHKGMINNYFSSLCKGKKLSGDFLFEGGTSLNPVLVEELANKLIQEGYINNKSELIVPKPYNTVIGSIGAAIIGLEKDIKNLRSIPKIENFKFIENSECFNCSNKCGAKITKVEINNKNITIGKTCQM
ncbi:MAG: acyl-CoA dehydratase activase [Candidatus Gracilibacteria bacterium]